MIENFKGKVAELSKVVDSWYEETRENPFRIRHSPRRILRRLKKLISSKRSALFVLKKDDKYVGFLGVQIIISPSGYTLIAEECFWYVLPEHRGIESVRMLKTARQWAKKRRCSFFKATASRLANPIAQNKICELYERMGMSKMEDVYIQRI